MVAANRRKSTVPKLNVLEKARTDGHRQGPCLQQGPCENRGREVRDVCMEGLSQPRWPLAMEPLLRRALVLRCNATRDNCDNSSHNQQCLSLVMNN